MTRLRQAELRCELIQIHPEPPRLPKPKPVLKRAATKTPTTRAVKKSAAKSATKKPTAKKPPPKRRA
jgi:hypothetical protein